jgi:hypothetical protein
VIGPVGRETRLLVVTLVVSVVLLLVLARFRFPAADRPQPAAIAAPLERLAARATFDELARIMAGVERRVSPSTLVLDVTASEAGRVPGEAVPRRSPALRVRDDMALIALQQGELAVAIAGQPGVRPELVGLDEVRGLAVVRVPAAAAPTLSVEEPARDASARYVAIVEASPSGPSVRPLFLGKLDPVADPGWPHPLLSLGSVLTATPGSFVFTLDGGLLGMTVSNRGLPALVPAAHVLAAADQLTGGLVRRRGDLGISWQGLTPALARATGTRAGVVVAGVDPDGPAAGFIESGDVVASINGYPIRATADARLAAAAAGPGSGATLEVHRGGESRTVSLMARQRPEPGTDSSAALGVVARAQPDGLLVVRVTPESAGDRAGLLPGDVITRVDREPVARTTNLARAWSEAPPGRTWLLTVTRANAPAVLALEKP